MGLSKAVDMERKVEIDNKSLRKMYPRAPPLAPSLCLLQVKAVQLILVPANTWKATGWACMQMERMGNHSKVCSSF